MAGRLSALAVATAFLAFTVGTTPGCRTTDDGTLVLAAASTVDALDAALREYRSRTGERVRVSYGSTSTLARQIEAGAPADLLLSASRSWAERVSAAGRVRERGILVRNRLVVVEPAASGPPRGSPEAPEAASEAARELLLAWIADASARLAIADPDAVPAGVYARQALVSLDLWTLLQPRLVPTVDVRAALALAARGEVTGAFVYRSDARSTGRVRTVLELDASLHGPITYPLLLLEPARPAARRLWRWLLSEEGRRPFRQRGFLTPEDEPDG